MRKGERAYRRGLAAHRAGRHGAAEAQYRAALARNPGHAEALHHLGLIAWQDGDHEGAIGLIQAALAIRPWYPEAAANLGLPLTALGRSADAVATLSLALAMKPGYADALYNLGVAHERAQDFAAAAASYRETIALRPEHADAHCNLAILRHAAGDRAAAIDGYRRALHLAPHLARLQVYLAIALCETGDFAASQAAARDAVAARPDDPAGWVALADARYYAGDLAGSLPPLAEALRRLHAAGATAGPWAQPRVPSYARRAFTAALHATIRCLERAGIAAFLTGGTLLGALREGDFISFDKDIDFGVFDAVPAAELCRALEADPDMTLSRRNGPEPVIVTYSWRGHVAIDFFRFFRAPDATWCGLYCDEHLIRWRHRPFGLVDFVWHGVTVKIPDAAERFLAEDYGDWRVPNPYFHLFASPCIEGGLPPICRSIAYTAIFRALVRRERDRSLSLCEQVLALDPQDGIVRALRDAIRAGAAGAAARAGDDAAQTVMTRLGQRHDRG